MHAGPRTKPGRLWRTLSGSQQLPFKSVLNRNRRKHFGGVQITLTRFIDDPYQAKHLCFWVVFERVKLACSQRPSPIRIHSAWVQNWAGVTILVRLK